MKRKHGNQYDIVFLLFATVLGMLMGWIAYDLEGRGIIGAIIGNIGIWLFFASLLSYYSQSGIQAALHSFLFYTGSAVSYYVHGYFAGSGFPWIALLTPLIFSAIGALIGFLTYHAGAKEWLGAICAAVPISLLIAEGYPIYHSRSWSLLFDIICAVILYVLLAPGKYQKLMALPFIIIFTFALVYFGAFTRIFGGWI